VEEGKPVKFEDKLNLVMEISLKPDIPAKPGADPLRYSRVLFMLAEIRQKWMAAVELKDEVQLIKLARSVMGLIRAAAEDGIIDFNTGTRWMYKALPGVEFRTATSEEKESEEKINDFLAKFGIGPNYIPEPPKTYECPRCKKHNAVFEEVHPDTDMNEILLCCPDCGYSGAKPSAK